MQSATPEDYKRISEFIFEAQTLSDQAADDLFSRRFPDGDLLRSQAERLWKRAKRIRSEDACSGFRTGEDLSVNGVELSRQLGSGGNGIVFSALQKSPHRAIAIKFLKGVHLDAPHRERFNREIELLTQLDHPDIIKVFDAGTTAQGRAYFTMEYVEGKNIIKHCSDSILPLLERLEMFVRLCHAVDHGHQHLILHRDLKPSNILVTADNHLKLIDFGIGRLRYPDPDDEQIARYLKQQPFDENYSSPELIGNDIVGVETDTYSLGIILYQLLTDKLPRRLDPRRPSIVSSAEQANKLGLKNVKSMRRALAGDLDLIVMKAIHPIPGARYPHPNDLAQDLKNFLARVPIQARDLTLAYAARLFTIRNSRWVALSCALLLGLMAAAVTATLQKRVADEAAAAARKSAQQARNAQSASELEKDRSMRTSEVYRRSMEILAKQLAQTSLQQRRALAEVYWELAQQGTGEPKLDATLVRRAIDYADETDPNLTQMKARYDALAKVNDFPQRGPELARGPSPLSLLRMQLQIARTQLDGDGKISDLDGLKSIVNKSFGLMKVDPEGAKAFRSSVCGSDATSKALRRSLSDLDRLCGLKMIDQSVLRVRVRK